jgi:gluconate 2-dehydrogenase gamma chain
MGERTTRRDLLRTAGVTGAVVYLPAAALAQASQPSVPNNIIPAQPAPAGQGPTPATGQGTSPRFFLTEPEAVFLFAAAARLIPGDAASPSAAEAGFVDFIDRQLAGSYGGGERLYLQGPWKPETSRQGYQLRYTPRELYRTALAALDGLTRGRFGNAASRPSTPRSRTICWASSRRHAMTSAACLRPSSSRRCSRM